MKRFFITLAVALMIVPFASAQTKGTLKALKELNKAKEAVSKKNDASSWTKLATAYLYAYEAPVDGLYNGMDPMSLAAIIKGSGAVKLGTEQINWLTAYDVVDSQPLLSHIYSGADPDKISVKALFERYNFSNTEFLADRGFNTDPDKELMSSNGNTYIVPMISNRKDYAAIIEILKFDKRKYFVFNKDSYASMIYYAEYVAGDDSCRRIAFQDTTRAGAERQDYIKAMAAGKSGYTEEGLVENELYFGLFLLETNDFDLSAEEVFCHYKDRWSIETYYNYVRNDADFNALYQQDYFCMQGLSFIVTIAGMIYHDIKKIADESKLSVKEIMREMKKLKITLNGNKWVVENKIKSVRDVTAKVGFDIPKYLPENPVLPDCRVKITSTSESSFSEIATRKKSL